MKKDIRTYVIALLSFCFFTHEVWAQVNGDFRTNSTTLFAGNWNDTNTWERYNGTTWDDAGTGSNSPALTPTSANSVWIQTGATITLTANAACNDLHICTYAAGSPTSTSLGKVAIDTYTMSVNGKLRCYYGTLTDVPGTSTSIGYAIYPFTGTGKVSIVGNTRNLTNTGEWSATITTQTGAFPLEINLTSGQTVTLQTGLTCSSLSVVSSGTTTFSGNINCSGTLDIGNNTIDIGGTTLTINGDYISGTGNIKSNGSASIIITGTGALTSSLSFDQSTPGTTNRLKDFTLSRTSSGSITLGNTLEITGTITLSNGTLNTGGMLTLVSNISGTARVATIPGTADISGNVKTQRYVPAVTRRYRMFSPNTAGFTFNDMLDNIFVTGPGGAANGFDPSGTNSPSIYTYQEDTTGGRGWKAISTISQGLTAGSGALVFVRGDRSLTGWNTSPFPAQNAVTIDFNGAINKGTIAPSITYSNTGDPGSDGWNLVGNPYPSQIDWLALSKSNIDANYYILDPSTGSYVSDNGSNYIASGQAFFVQATGVSPNISFSESAKVGTAPTNYFKTNFPKIEIKMVKDSLNSDLAWLELNPNASKGFVRGEDALKFSNSLINFGFYIDSIYTTQRNSVPMPVIADTFTMSAYAAAGTYSLQFANVSSSLPSSKNIYLKDLFNSNLINLRTTATYNFSISSNPASYGNRFQLIISDPSMLPVKLVDFYAEKDSKNNEVILHWSSSSQQNTDHFIIERSIDNTNDFTQIGIVAANRNSQTIIDYQFNDHDIPGKNIQTIFYRLKQFDHDGSFLFSKIVSLNWAAMAENALILYPNPANEILNIKQESQIQGNVSIAVYNIVGKCILNSNIFAMKGKDITIDISQFQIGIYILKIILPTGKQAYNKFTKE